ncbi:MAG: DUF5658 family protein [Haloferacaceae archaeon]
MTAARGDSAADRLWRRRRGLWVIAVLFFAVGDVATTLAGLQFGRVVEAGPVVAPLIEVHGAAAMVALKAATFGCCYALYRVAARPHGVGVPLGLAALGVLATGRNLVVLAVAAS